MTEPERTSIPLDDAHEVLSMFGIGPSSPGYRRWRRDDGFRQVDFENILNESAAVLAVDWREWLQDVVDVILRQLGDLGLTAAAELEDEGNEGELRMEGKLERIKFVPADEDDFDTVIASVNRLIAQSARYRKFRSCEGSDGWSYAILKNEDWQALDGSARATVDLLFR